MKHGFSLVELMAVVAIIAVLASLTLPRYNAFVARSRMGEAKTNLKHIQALQALYRSENAEYYDSLEVGNISGGVKCGAGSAGEELRNELGFQPDDCAQLRYGYTTSASSINFGGTAYYDGSAGVNKHIYPKCKSPGTGADRWVIDISTKPSHDINVIQDCE